MPRYSKSQPDGFVADRRYWDKKHPEHQAHLDFTVKAFEAAYPDPVAPTQEQEEWAASEEKRLRELGKRRPFWDSRDPGHADARAEFYRGFDKINAVLYGTPEPGGDAPAASKTDARDPLDPVLPAPDGFARAARATQMAQAAQAAQAQQPPQAPAVADIGEDGFRRQLPNTMSWPQFQRNFIENEGRAPAPGNPNRTIWQAQSEQAQRGAEAARQRAIAQERGRRDLDAGQRQLENRAPEDWDRERPMPQMTNPVPGAPIRAPDNQGGGRFGAGRGNRSHAGVDIEAAPGTDVVAPVSGTIGRTFDPYRGTDRAGRFTAFEVHTDDGYLVRLLYVTPAEGLVQGARVEKGQTRVGQAQDISSAYRAGMTNHVHMDVQRSYPIPNDKDGRPSNQPPMRMFVDPTPYIREN